MALRNGSSWACKSSSPKVLAFKGFQVEDRVSKLGILPRLSDRAYKKSYYILPLQRRMLSAKWSISKFPGCTWGILMCVLRWCTVHTHIACMHIYVYIHLAYPRLNQSAKRRRWQCNVEGDEKQACTLRYWTCVFASMSWGAKIEIHITWDNLYSWIQTSWAGELMVLFWRRG